MNEVTAPIEAVYAEALAQFRQGRLGEVSALCESILHAHPRAFGALYLLGNAHLGLGRCEAAIASYDSAIAVKPGYADAHYHRGNALFDMNLHKAAIDSYDRVLALQSDHLPAHNNRGLALWRLGRHEAAIASFDTAIRIEPAHADAHNYRGHALRDLTRFEAAIASYEAAIALRPDYAEAYNARGSILAALKQYDAALESYGRAIEIQANFAEAHLNRGNVMHEQGLNLQALANYDQAIVIHPQFAEAYYKRGDVQRILGQFDAAAASFDRAVELKPDLKFLRGARWHMRMHLCDWREYETDVAQLTAGIERGETACLPFPALALSESAALHRQAAQIYVREECPPNPALPAIVRRPRPHKIRIGYFSPDFRNHPVSLLTAGIFEAHDRSAFEVLAFSMGPDTEDEMRSRLRRAFDQFIDVKNQTDLEIALLARSLEIDIAIDLGGFTGECRPKVFALRAAPLQLCYVGYLGSMAAPYIDYLVADAMTVPPASRRHYSESILYLPSYQANDSKRLMADKVFTPEELGLPPSGFVFCCFNTPYKISPPTFACWMRILRQVPGSVLFVYAAIPTIRANLWKEAQRAGVDSRRLVFGDALPLPEHLARYRTMDLFLDTLPYNAGTTASDALWAGLPVLTCTGEAFASRMAASLLTAIDLPELIAPTLESYEALAVALAQDPQRLAGMKRGLDDQRLKSPLFDIERFTRHLEAGYREIHQRYQGGLPPRDTYVEAVR